MFGNNEYWWAGLLFVAWFAGLNVAIHFLRKKPRLCYAIAYTIAVFLLTYKIGEYVYYQAVGLHWKIPLEFSAMSYFLFGIFVMFRIWKADGFPVFAATLAGMIYIAAWWMSPDSFIREIDTPFLLGMAIVNHSLLYFGGMLMLAGCRRYKPKIWWQYVIGTGALVAYGWIIYLFTPYTQPGDAKPTIIRITDATVLAEFLHVDNPSAGATVAYYVCAILLMCLLVAGAFFLNALTAKSRVKNGLPEDASPDRFSDVYKIK